MIRSAAGYDASRYSEVLKWPVREGLLCYVEKLKEEAAETYKLDVLLYAMGAQSKKPDLPTILQ